MSEKEDEVREFKMEQQISRLRAITLVRFLSLVLAGLGVGALIIFVIGLVHDFQHPPTATSLLVQLVCGALSLVVVIWWLWAAWLGWNHRSAAALRWLITALFTSIMCVGLIVTGDIRFTDAGKPRDSSPHEPLEFLAAPLVVGLHFFLYRVLTTRLDLKDERSVQQQKRSVERSLGLATLLFRTCGVNVAIDLVPKVYGTKYVPEEPWEFVAILGPILLAGIIYKVGVRLLTPTNVSATI
jgi:hypothetical protein